MKIISCLLVLITTSFTLWGQNIIVDSIHPLFKGELNGDLIREQFAASSSPRNAAMLKNNPVISIGVFSSNKLSVTRQMAHEKLPELKNFNLDSSAIMEVPAGGYAGKFAIPVFDSSGIIVTVNGITQQNAADYEFRVLENKTKEILTWQRVKLFCEPYFFISPNGIDETEVAYLGQFKTGFGNSLTIQVRKKNPLKELNTLQGKSGSENIVASISALWINRAPSVLGVFTTNNMQSFLAVFKTQWQNDVLMLQTVEERKTKDSLLVLQKEFKPGENNLIFYLDDKIRTKEIIEYNLVLDGKSSGWKINDFDLNLIWLKNLVPGKYALQIRYSIQRPNVFVYEFTVAAAWHQTLAFKIIAVALTIGLIGFVLLFFKSRRQKLQLQKEALQKHQTQTELKSIRSQFNPHFVFNALSSIQSLITKNDTEGANKYLSEFSTLLRDSLKGSSNEMISLTTEIKMLESYLNLEQLRFGFTYTITTDSAIDKNAIDVPALLLQPLVENAVKHGIASLYKEGNLNINFKKDASDMLVIITDNGKGFDTGAATNGYGMKLTHDRISLLNKILKEQSIEMVIDSSVKGTNINLLFKNWLL
ncbi:sensor histidine kinase [Ferruginibacter sp. SUN106]|uniref:sensor histidine kinase n=1 Tax=Ferruginibacter sp. SUN106 TaxID=2978348 RepID=UPI003D36064F